MTALHPSTLRAITKIAQEAGEPVVRADANCIIVGTARTWKEVGFWLVRINGSVECHATAPDALRAALGRSGTLIRYSPAPDENLVLSGRGCAAIEASKKGKA